MNRSLAIVLFAVFLVALPTGALGNDLGDALGDIHESGMQEQSPSIDDGTARPFDDAAMAMLGSRDVPKGKDISEYDCWGSLVDADPKSTFRYGDNEKVTNRWCHEHKWKRDHIPGYKTLGKVRLTKEAVRPLIEAAAAENDIPYTILDTYIRFSSGYRPGVISDRGEQGLFQLRPEVIAEMGLKNPLDTKANIQAGTRYLGLMLDRYNGQLEPALAALLVGPKAVDRNGGSPPDDRRVVWFVREVRRLYLVELTKFPAMAGAANIAHVLTLTENPH